MPNNESEGDKFIRQILGSKKEFELQLQKQKQQQMTDEMDDILSMQKRIKRAHEAADAFVERCNAEFEKIRKEYFGE